MAREAAVHLCSRMTTSRRSPLRSGWAEEFTTILTKAVRFVFAVHVPIAGMALLPVVFNWPILLMPLHIVFIELIIDPASSMAFEAEPGEPGIMQRKPRSKDARLFDRSTVAIGLLQGLGLLLAVLATFAALNAFRTRIRRCACDRICHPCRWKSGADLGQPVGHQDSSRNERESKLRCLAGHFGNHGNPFRGLICALSENTFPVLRFAPE